MPLTSPARVALNVLGEHQWVDCIPGPTDVQRRLTVEAWICPHFWTWTNDPSGRSPDPVGTVLSQGDGSGTDGYTISVTPTEVIVDLVNGKVTARATVVGYRMSTWHHLAFTLGDGQVTVYLNGQVRATTTFSERIPVSAQRFSIGRDTRSAGQFSGFIAEVRVWNITRSAAELREHMHVRCTGREWNLVGYWPLDGVAANRTSRGGTGIFRGVTWAGQPGLPLVRRDERVALQMPGGTLRFATPPARLDGFTIEAWVRLADAGDAMTITWQGSTGVPMVSAGVGSGTVSLTIKPDWTSSASFSESSSDTAPLAPQRWHHVAFTRGRTAVALFLNGSRVAEFPTDARSLSVDQGVTEIRPGRAHLSDVRVWTVTRGPDEIAAGKDRRLGGAEAGLVGYWPLDRPGLTVNDFWDRAADGTPLSDGVCWVAAPDLPIGKAALGAAAMSFRNRLDRLECGPRVLRAGDDVTVEAWVRVSGEGVVVSHGRPWEPFSYGLRVGPSSVTLAMTSTGTTADTASVSADLAPSGSWRHVAATIKSGRASLFVDGAPVADGPVLPGQPIDGQLWLGFDGRTDLVLTGSLAEVRVWAVCRTPEEIAGTRTRRLTGREAGLIAYLPLSEGTGATVVDRATAVTAQLFGGVWAADPELTLAPAADRIGPPRPAIVTTRATATGAVRPPVGLAPARSAPVPAPATTAVRQDFVSRPDEEPNRLIAQASAARGPSGLNVSDSTFPGFSPFADVRWLLSSLWLRDARIETLHGVEVDPAQITAGTASTVTVDAGLRLTGTASPLGLTDAAITVELAARSDATRTTLVTIRRSGPLDLLGVLGGGLPVEVTTALDQLGALTLRDPVLAFATHATDAVVDPYGLPIRPGLNLFATVDVAALTAPGGPPLRQMLGLVAGLLGRPTVTVRLALDKSPTGVDLDVDLAVAHDLTVLDGSDVRLTLVGTELTASWHGSPALSASGTLELSLTYLGADRLRLTGTLRGEIASFTGAFTLQTPPEEPWHPFGIEALSVAALAVELGGTYVEPYLTSVGIATRELTIGTGTDAVRGSLAVLVDTTAPDHFVVAVQTPEITLLQLISGFSPLTLVAVQALPTAVAAAFRTVFDIRLTGPTATEDVTVSIVPVATRIGTLTYDDEGVHARGAVSLWGWRARAGVRLAPDRVDLTAGFDPVDVTVAGVPILRVRDQADRTGGPILRGYLGTADLPQFTMAIAANLLGLQVAALAVLDSDGLSFGLHSDLGFVSTSLRATVNRSLLTATGRLTFDLDLSLPIPVVGSVLMIDTGFEAQADLRVDGSFTLRLSGSLKLFDRWYPVKLNLDRPVADLSALLEAVVAYLIENATLMFGELWKTFEQWALAVSSGAIMCVQSVAAVAKQTFGLGVDAAERIIRISATLGNGPAMIAANLRWVYDIGVDLLCQGFRATGYSAVMITEGLRYGYRAAAEQVAIGLTAAGFVVTEIGGALGTVYRLTADAVIDSLKAAGYTVVQIASGLQAAQAALSSAAAAVVATGYQAVLAGFLAAQTAVPAVVKEAAAAFKRAGYLLTDIGRALQAVYHSTFDQCVQALTSAGFVATETIKVADQLYQPAAGAIAHTMSTLGQTAVQIAGVLKNTKSLSVEAIAAALTWTSFGASEVAKALTAVGGPMSAQAAADLLRRAGYQIRAIGFALKDAFGQSLESTVRILRGLGSAAVEVGLIVTAAYQVPMRAISETLAKALTSAGYPVREITRSMQAACSAVATEAAAALHAAGHAAGQVAEALLAAYRLPGQQAAVALQLAGYGAREVGAALRVTYGASVEMATQWLRSTSYAAGVVGEAFADTGAAIGEAFNF